MAQGWRRDPKCLTVAILHICCKRTRSEKVEASLAYLQKTEAVAALLEQLAPFGRHQFIARWQQKAFKQTLGNLKSNQVIVVADFAENYTAQCQEEAQSANYS